MGIALAALAIALPWFVWFPFVTAPATTVLLGAISIIGAFHGWGRLVARVADREDVDSALAVQWGVATVVALGGLLLAFGIYNPQLLIVSGCAAHSVDLAMRLRRASGAIRSVLVWNRVRFWILPFALIAIVAVVNTLGAAGEVAPNSNDDEGDAIAQVERLSTTGKLADPIGYPRETQLGGHVTLGALVAAFGDARLERTVDRGIGLVLFLLLLCARIRPRDAESAIWTSLLIILAASFQSASGVLPLWIPAGLILALHGTLTTTSTSPRAVLPIGLLVGALCVIRCELVPFAIAILAATWWGDRRPLRRDWQRIAPLVGPVLLVVVSYAVARHAAWSSVSTSARALIGVKPFAWKRLVPFAAIACAIVPLISLACRELEDRALRVVGIAAAIGTAAVAGRVVGAPPASTQLLWPIAIAGFSAVAISLSSQQTLRRTAMVVGALLCIFAVEAQTEPGRRGWSRRYDDLLADVQYSRNLAGQGGSYAELVAHVPAGERIAVWIARPELLDYQHHAVVDLRTPRATSKNLERLVRATRARWLMVEGIADVGLVNVLEKARTVANTGGIQLVELR